MITCDSFLFPLVIDIVCQNMDTSIINSHCRHYFDPIPILDLWKLKALPEIRFPLPSLSYGLSRQLLPALTPFCVLPFNSDHNPMPLIRSQLAPVYHRPSQSTHLLQSSLVPCLASSPNTTCVTLAIRGNSTQTPAETAWLLHNSGSNVTQCDQVLTLS